MASQDNKKDVDEEISQYEVFIDKTESVLDWITTPTRLFFVVFNPVWNAIPESIRTAVVRVLKITWTILTWINLALNVPRYAFSMFLFTIGGVLIIWAIVEGSTNFWDQVPWPVSLVLLVVLMWGLFTLEGLQIAIAEIRKQNPSSYKTSHSRAYRVGKMAYYGRNVERFVVGRQVLTVVFTFFLARLTTMNGWGLFPDIFEQIFFESGLIGALFVIIGGISSAKLLATKVPLTFLNLPGMDIAFISCLAVEFTGLSQAAVLLADLFAWMLQVFEYLWCCLGLRKLYRHILIPKDDEEDKDVEVEGMELLSTIEDPVEFFEWFNGLQLNWSDYPLPFKRPTEDEFKNEYSNEEKNRFDFFSKYFQLMKVTDHRIYDPQEGDDDFHVFAGGEYFRDARSVATALAREGKVPPRFLLPSISDLYIPPHIAACRLVALNDLLAKRGQEAVAELKEARRAIAELSKMLLTK